MKTKEEDYQQSKFSYCVNYKGQKIKPYKSNYKPYKKETLLTRIINCILNK